MITGAARTIFASSSIVRSEFAWLGRSLRLSRSRRDCTIEVRALPERAIPRRRTPRSLPRPRSKKGAGSSQALDRGCSQTVCDSMQHRSLQSNDRGSRRLRSCDWGSRVGGLKLRPSWFRLARTTVVHVVFDRTIEDDVARQEPSPFLIPPNLHDRGARSPKRAIHPGRANPDRSQGPNPRRARLQPAVAQRAKRSRGLARSVRFVSARAIFFFQ